MQVSRYVAGIFCILLCSANSVGMCDESVGGSSVPDAVVSSDRTPEPDGLPDSGAAPAGSRPTLPKFWMHPALAEHNAFYSSAMSSLLDKMEAADDALKREQLQRDCEKLKLDEEAARLRVHAAMLDESGKRAEAQAVREQLAASESVSPQVEAADEPQQQPPSPTETASDTGKSADDL